jgi:hypothetical protein
MIAVGAMAAMFHVTPTMAESQAGAPPLAGQVASPASPIQSGPKSSSSPLVVKPTDKGHTARSIHRNRSNGEHPEPSRVEQERIDRNLQQQIDDAQEQMSKARIMLDSREFKQQMEDLRRQMADVTAKIDSPEFKQQMEDLKRQMADSMEKMNSPELKKQMEDAQRQMSTARTMLNSPEFKRQMDDLQKQLQNEEFERRMNEDSPRPGKAPSQTGNTPIN